MLGYKRAETSQQCSIESLTLAIGLRMVCSGVHTFILSSVLMNWNNLELNCEPLSDRRVAGGPYASIQCWTSAFATGNALIDRKGTTRVSFENLSVMTTMNRCPLVARVSGPKISIAMNSRGRHGLNNLRGAWWPRIRTLSLAHA